MNALLVLTSVLASLAPHAVESGVKSNVESNSARDAEAYCEYIQATATSQSLPLIWPDLQLTGGILNAFEADQSSALVLRPRFMAGLRYSASSLVRGLTMRNQAAELCKHYRASTQLRGLVERTRDGLPRGPLAAKLAVLQAALPQAEAVLARQRSALKQAQTTLMDVHNFESRLDGLRAAMTGAQQDLETASNPELSSGVETLIAERRAADENLQTYQQRLDSTALWDVTLRGGYDRIIDLPERLPVYGAVTLTVNLGVLALGDSHAVAQRAHAAWSAQEGGGLEERVRHTQRRLSAMLTAHSQRVTDLERQVARLDDQQRTAGNAPGGNARTLVDALWFDRINAEADLAYAHAHTHELRSLLSQGAGAP